MLTELRVTNFKGFGDTHSVPLAPLTLLFGSNSSGKTALLHAIALLAENLAPSLLQRPSRQFDLSVPDLDLGGYRNLIYRHDNSPSAHMGLGLTADLRGYRPTNRENHLEALGATGASHDFTIVRDPRGNVVVSRSTAELHRRVDLPLDFVRAEEGHAVMQLASESFSRALVSGEGLRDLISQLAAASPDVDRDFGDAEDDIDLIELPMVEQVSIDQLDQVSPEALATLLFSGTGIFTPPGSLSHFDRGWGRRNLGTANMPAELAMLIEKVIVSANDILRQSLGRSDYLGPMREVPSRLEDLETQIRHRITSSGRGIAAILNRDRRSLELVNGDLRRLEIPYTLDVKSAGDGFLPSAGDYKALVLTDMRTNTEVSLRDLGFGISQLLPILVALARRPPSLFMVEQPELHLHPRLHAELASLLVDATRGDRPTQVIAETHSENLVLRVQKLVRDGQVSPEDVSIVYVGSSEGIGSWIQPIRMDDRGELIDEWPGGFFTERAQEWI